MAEKLDIHLKDGRVLQVDGDRFAFEILGTVRGLTDRENMDRLSELLAKAAPHAIVDPYFPLWKPPAEAKRMRLPRMLVNKDDPDFAFYSRWVAVMYRHMLGTEGPANQG